MGLGEALMEEQEFRLGVHKTPSMLDYKSPTSMDMCPDRNHPRRRTGPDGAVRREGSRTGARCFRCLLPSATPCTMRSVCASMKIPVTPEKILKALKAKSQGKDGRYGPIVVSNNRVSRSDVHSSAVGRRRWPLGQSTRVHTKGSVGDAATSRFHFSQTGKRVREAAEILAGEGPQAMLVAGGTDLWPKMKRRQMEPRVVIGFRHLSESARRFPVHPPVV